MELLFFLFLLSLVFPASVQAVCPVCTVAAGAGLGLSRWLGISDAVTGVWIGGLILSSGFWLADWLGKKNWSVPHLKIVSVFLVFLLTVSPLWWGQMLSVKILEGTAAGATLFLLGVGLDERLRTINHGRVYVYYQKVLLPILLLSLGSFILYILT